MHNIEYVETILLSFTMFICCNIFGMDLKYIIASKTHFFYVLLSLPLYGWGITVSSSKV